MLLTSPLSLRSGAFVAPSRVMFGPHETNLGAGRSFSERHVAYYARRAAGGAGIIVTEEASVHASDWPYERCPRADECGAGWAAVVGAVRSAASGTLVLAGLGHSGGQGSSAYSQRELWAPSGVPEVNTREVPKVMELRDIDAVVSGFGAAARLAIASGCDGVEINAGQFSLVRQFISGLTNQRTDDYGSDRLRFAREVLAAVRGAIGAGPLVALRLSCDELAPWAGVTPEAAVDVAVSLCQTGVDLLTVVRGSIFSAALTRPDQHQPPMFNRALSRSIRAGMRATGVEVPVVLQGSVVDVDEAENALTEQACDAVEMTRALLADADLVRKVEAGESARVRPCLLCNQACKVRDNRNPIVSCVMDPRTGYETIDATERTASAPASATKLGTAPVTVVGGGIAGLEAARWLAVHGQPVRILERSPSFGGVVRIAARGAGRDRLALAADWLESECRRLGVVLESGVAVHDLPSGKVILAVGGKPSPVPFLMGDGAVVVDATVVLADPSVLPEGKIAVWDPLGGPIAISIAELLAAAGRPVVLITPDLLVGEKLSLSGDLAPAQPRLHAAGVELVKRVMIRRVELGAVFVEDRFSGATSTIEAAAVVACAHRLPDHTLGGDDALRIGDAVAPRSVLEAILEGRRGAASVLSVR